MEMKKVNTIQYDVELYQVKTTIVNCTDQRLILLGKSIVNIINVAKADTNFCKYRFKNEMQYFEREYHK